MSRLSNIYVTCWMLRGFSHASALGEVDLAEAGPGEADDDDHVVTIALGAMTHLGEMRKKLGLEENQPLHIRMGVRSGGCSGMSYVMDVCKPEDVTDDDHIEDWAAEKVRCVIDPKSLLYLFGLQLDYSNELIGGGFNFQNPNAETTCGCGKSFNV
mmetsp:Transcript_31636/g.71107  ORF Transcript_31636/g.71107 Transcript_31636/m.71107 type:complete len:156 (+) Transcript_31636:278-745(+)